MHGTRAAPRSPGSQGRSSPWKILSEPLTGIVPCSTTRNCAFGERDAAKHGGPQNDRCSSEMHIRNISTTSVFSELRQGLSGSQQKSSWCHHHHMKCTALLPADSNSALCSKSANFGRSGQEQEQMADNRCNNSHAVFANTRELGEPLLS